jgi:hypothetical protein
MGHFKIENFCDEHNEEFKKYYNYLNNPFYVSIFMKLLSYMNHEIIKKKIYNLIVKNKKYIYERFEKVDIIIHFYEQNNLIKKSEIGKFFLFYQKSKKTINIKSNKALFKFFYKLISYENILSVLKECFYIFSNYRACIYYMTPSINFHNTKKDKIDKVVLHFKDNINTLNQIVSKVYIGDQNPWGSIYYSTSYAMFETLIILKKYYKDPLNKLNIKFTHSKKADNENILKNLYKKYLIAYKNTKFEKNNTSQCNILQKKVNNVSHFILLLKKLGYNLWIIIPCVFNIIFQKYNFKGIPESNIIGNKLIYQQKFNNAIGVMAFILVKMGYISNVLIFNQ